MATITLELDDVSAVHLCRTNVTPRELREVLEDALMEYIRARAGGDARAWVLFAYRPTTERETQRLVAKTTRDIQTAMAVRRLTRARFEEGDTV